MLYTNSVRSELNDLAVFARSLRALWARAFLGLSATKLAAVRADFENWWRYFSAYADAVLAGFEHVVFPFVSNAVVSNGYSELSWNRARDSLNCRVDDVRDLIGPVVVFARKHSADSWVRERLALTDKMENVRDLISTVHSRWHRFHRIPYLEQFGKDANVVNVLLRSVDELVPAMVDLLHDLDAAVAPRLALGKRLGAFDDTSILELHAQLAELICHGSASPLGWSGVVTLTHWLDHKNRLAIQRGVMRGCRRNMLRRTLTESHHHAVAESYREREEMFLHEKRKQKSFAGSVFRTSDPPPVAIQACSPLALAKLHEQ